MKTVIIVQARMGSTRLPGKVLKKIMGRPLLEYQIERLRKINHIDDIVIATTTDQNDQSIVNLCMELNCSYFRGSENDVLLRYYDAADAFNAECVVRINSDCPLIDCNVVERVVNHYHSNVIQYDYVSNIIEPSYPIGLHTEVFSQAALELANNNAVDPVEREHVTPYIYRNPEIFKIDSVALDADLSHYRWTVDYPEDFYLIEHIIKDLYPLKADFDMFDIINYLKSNPGLIDINSGIEKKQTL